MSNQAMRPGPTSGLGVFLVCASTEPVIRVSAQVIAKIAFRILVLLITLLNSRPHTNRFEYPLREKWEGYVVAYKEARAALHTHFVRSGSLMLWPVRPETAYTLLNARLQHHIPTSHEVGM